MLPVLVYHHRAATSTLLGCSTVRDVHLRVDSSYEQISILECGLSRNRLFVLILFRAGLLVLRAYLLLLGKLLDFCV